MQRFKFHFCQHGAARATITTTTPTLVSRKAFKPAQKSIKRTKQQPPSPFPSLPHSSSPSQFLQTQLESDSTATAAVAAAVVAVAVAVAAACSKSSVAS